MAIYCCIVCYKNSEQIITVELDKESALLYHVGPSRELLRSLSLMCCCEGREGIHSILVVVRLRG